MCDCASWLSALLRISLGWIFLWAFLDKLFGWGFATEAGAGWIDGGSPTFGFLQFGAKGPFAEVFHGMAESVFVEWLFMLGLLGIGLALMTGVMMRIAGWAGAVLMLLMWLAVLPPEHNPFMDDHIIYALLLLWMAYNPSCGNKLGLGTWWNKMDFVQKYPFLR